MQNNKNYDKREKDSIIEAGENLVDSTIINLKNNGALDFISIFPDKDGKNYLFYYSQIDKNHLFLTGKINVGE